MFLNCFPCTNTHMKKATCIIWITFLFGTLRLSAQCLAPFSEANNSVHIFDGGQSRVLEATPVQRILVGRNNIAAYITQNGLFKVYYNGEAHDVHDIPSAWYMTDNWLLYQSYDQIKILCDTGFQTIETQFRQGIDTLVYGDSLIVWTNTQNDIKVYYNGQIQIIDRLKIRSGKATDNMFVFVDYLGLLKVFYQGEVRTLETYQPVFMNVNRDMVVYVDQYDNLKFFQEGQVYETNMPMSSLFYTGEGFAVYLTPQRELAVYYRGEQTILNQDLPDTLLVKENIMAYTDKGNNFLCWYKGKKYLLERYVPLSFKADNDMLVYQDLDGRLKAFYYGEQVQVSDQIVKSYNLYNETVTYSIQPYQTKVWCKKETFTFQ